MLLESVNSPQDLKRLSIEQLVKLSGEIRQRILEVVSVTGGHLASSLGAVELAIALHYCLDTPQDKIVWDVGHQAYAHKILTGRNKDFTSLRQYKGISGFPSKDESAYDPFITGHSSTAVSLALGLACAKDCAIPKKDFKVVAVIGDGSLSGGLCFEGMNNAGHLKKDILVVLNTNELSIAPNVGALSTYLNKIISLPIYNRFRSSLEGFLKSRVPKGSRLMKIANKFEEGLKSLFIPGMLFEELGFRYFGPFDGHNLSILIPTIKNILAIKGPMLLHVITKKGKGYLPAENEPVRFHGIGPFDIRTGLSLSKEPSRLATYTDVFGRKVLELARRDTSIIAVTAAMAEGTGLARFRDLYPERFFDVGIAEAHAVCFASGLAREGLKPVVAIYSTFLQRAYDQIIEDIALQKAAVVLAIDRAGIAGEDGPTHQGIFDIAFLRNIPNFVVMAPHDAKELEAMLEFALNLGLPVAIRYPKAVAIDVNHNKSPLELGKAEILREGKDAAIFALGSMVSVGLSAARILAASGIEVAVINSRFVKPLDTVLFRKISERKKPVFTIEEGIIEAGFGSAVSEAIDTPVVKFGLPAEFIAQGRRDILLEKYGLTPRAIADKIESFICPR